MNVFLLTFIFSGLGLSAIIIGNLPKIKRFSSEELDIHIASSKSSRRSFFEAIFLPIAHFYKHNARFWFYRLGEEILNMFRFFLLKSEKVLFLLARRLKKKRSLEMNNKNASKFLKDMNEWKNGNGNDNNKNNS